MPKYLALFSYSKEAIAAMIENPADREAAVRHVAESVGGRLESFYWMRGQFDGMAIIDAPDSITMAGIESAVKGSGAAVHSETHDLFSPDDIQHILEHARVARSNFTQPGQAS
jgi:uncharacterized protein with GYD domain